MQLRINDEYRIKSDAHCWMIQKRQNFTDKNTGEKIERFVSIKYYSTLDQTVKNLGQLMLRTSEAETLTQALEKIDRITTTLCRALTPISKVTQNIKYRSTDKELTLSNKY